MSDDNYKDEEEVSGWLYYGIKCHICGGPVDENNKCKDADNEEHQNAS